LLIPAILFWQALPQIRALWKPLFALIWITTFISGPLTYLQLKVLPIAIQISIPVLSYTLFVCFKSLITIPPKELNVIL
jgi:hypothetical protein